MESEITSVVFDKKVSQDHAQLEAIQGKDQQPDAPSWFGKLPVLKACSPVLYEKGTNKLTLFSATSDSFQS